MKTQKPKTRKVPQNLHKTLVHKNRKKESKNKFDIRYDLESKTFKEI